MEPVATDQHQQTPRAAPLWVGLTITWLGSLGTGAATNGVYFVADQMHGFSRAENLWLGVFFGMMFVPAAFLSGKATRLLERRVGWSERGVLLAVLLGITASCVFAGYARAAWSIWVFVALFAPLTGMLWPLVEGFISGGRRGKALRGATGKFNLAWASATFGAYWFMRPLLEIDPAWVFYGLGAVHLLSAGFTIWLPRFPGRHGSAAHAHDPLEAASYRRLLACFRMLLMGSYILHSAMTPILPARFTALGVGEADRVLYASAWMGSRVLAFVVLERWHGWHGRRRTLLWSGGGMALGFAGVLLAPGVWWAVGALVVLGAGIGSAYAAALYYAMEVGDAQVDAGGAHEAMIGLGYTGGPLAALVAVGAADIGLIPSDHVDAWVLGVVGGVGLLVAFLILRRARRPLRAGVAAE
ncbi:MAG: hypothetical protein Tsb0013_13370 [Phycisphaerales bacterium]